MCFLTCEGFTLITLNVVKVGRGTLGKLAFNQPLIKAAASLGARAREHSIATVT